MENPECFRQVQSKTQRAVRDAGTGTVKGGRRDTFSRKTPGSEQSLLSDKVLAEGRAPNESALYACHPMSKEKTCSTVLNGTLRA